MASTPSEGTENRCDMTEMIEAGYNKCSRIKNKLEVIKLIGRRFTKSELQLVKFTVNEKCSNVASNRMVKTLEVLVRYS